MRKVIALAVPKNPVPDPKCDNGGINNLCMPMRIWVGVEGRLCTVQKPIEKPAPLAIPTSMNAERAQAILDFNCYNRGEKGHKAKDCKKPPQPKVHLWAAH